MRRYGMTPQQATVTLLSQRYGANVLSNGTFDSATTGWSAVVSPTTFEATGGRAHIVSDSNGDGMAQAVTLVLGARYRLMFDYQVVSGALNVTKVGMTSIAGLTGSGSHSLVFTESDGTARNLLFQSGGVSGEFYVDNIKLQRIL
jgi:hypothetical protein